MSISIVTTSPAGFSAGRVIFVFVNGSGAQQVSYWKVTGEIFPKHSGRDEKENSGLLLSTG